MTRWLDVLPEPTARRQMSWERRHALLRAYEAGAQQKDLAAHFGVTASRVHEQIVRARIERRMRRRSPVERYIDPLGVVK